MLSVLSFGYGVLQDGMQDAVHDPARLSIAVLLAMALGKILHDQPDHRQRRLGRRVRSVDGHRRLRRRRPWACCFQWIWPPMHIQPISFMIVGMAGFFAAAAKTPFSTLVMVCELTGDYRLIVPALWVCTLAFFLSDEQSLYDSQIESRNLSPAHQGTFVREALAGARWPRRCC